MYGKVELQDDLTINEGETLTVGKDASLTVPGGKTLTNEGTVTTEEGGTLTGSITNAPPKITTTTPLPDGTVGTVYNQQLAAENTPTQWSVTHGTLPNGLTLENGTIFGIPTAADTSTFTVKAENTAGSDSKELTLTINPAPVLVTSVALNKSGLSLYTGQSEILTATVQPEDATNKNVTWSSDRPEVATVENGEVTAKAAGTATITATAADGSGKSANCKVTVNPSTYSISADTTALDFGSVYTGYTQPAAQTVTITNTGNQPLTLTQPASTSSFDVGTLSTTELAAGEKAAFTVQPKAGLAVGTYSENITISGTHDVNETISATFTVKQYSSGGGTPTKTPSQQAVDKIESAKEGSTVEITLRTGQTKLDKEVFEELAGRDVTLEISLTGGVTWTVNGQDIPENADLTDLDMGVSLNTSTIPVNLINSVTGEAGTVQLTLKHNGEFGFTMTLTAPVGVINAGLWANLYRYDDEAGSLGYEATAQVDGEGVARLPFDHASSWLVALDSRGHALPFSDANDGEWYSEAVRWAWLGGVMTGYGDGSGLFGTSSALTRAEAAVALWRLAGEPEGASGLPADCDPSGFYAEAASWALGAGVFSGYSGDAFGPADPITREQLATVLWRAAGSPEAGGDLSSFSDAADVSGFADVAMRWAVSAGVLRGQGDGDALDPQGACTRAQLATMLHRLAAAE